MSNLTNKLNDYLIKKMAKSKVQYLFAVPKRVLLNRIHELSEEIEHYKMGDEMLLTTLDTFRKEIQETKVENNTLKTQLEARTDTKYQLAYERLVEKYESLTEENKSIKNTLDVVNDVVKNVSKQNEVLKDRIKRTETENERLVMENGRYKDKEKVIEIKKEAVKHNFNRKANTSSKNMAMNK